LCFSAAISILISEQLSTDPEKRKYAHNLLLHFISSAAELYGEHFMVYNVHSLSHLSAEIDMFGSLNNTSAFVFENYLQTLKKYVRSGNNPVLQVVHRLKEQAEFPLGTCQVTKMSRTLRNYSCKQPDNNCILDDGRCCQILSMMQETATCMVFKDTEPLYTNPSNIHQSNLVSRDSPNYTKLF
jgi:hypothetical protein